MKTEKPTSTTESVHSVLLCLIRVLLSRTWSNYPEKQTQNLTSQSTVMRKELETNGRHSCFYYCSNNPVAHTRTHAQICAHEYTIIPSPHTRRTHKIRHFFSPARSLSYMLSRRPYKADPLCSALTYFSLCLKRILALALSQRVLPIHTTGLSVLVWAGEVRYLRKVSFSVTGGRRKAFVF